MTAEVTAAEVAALEAELAGMALPPVGTEGSSAYEGGDGVDAGSYDGGAQSGGGRKGRRGVNDDAAYHLLQAQQARRAAAEDAQRLANRLAQLKKEEAKSLKRIDETRRRATQILELRRRNEAVRAEKDRLAHERAKELAGLAQELGKVRDEHVVRKRKTVEALRESKQQSKQEVMQQRKRNDAMLKEQQISDRKRAISSKETIRAKQAELRTKKEALRQQRLAEARAEFDKRVSEERKATSAKEKEIAAMAKEELSLISRLQKKQHEQREAYRQLEQALGLLKEDRAKGSKRPPSVTGSLKGGKGAKAKKKAGGAAPDLAANAAPAGDPAGDITEGDIHSAFAAFDPGATGEMATKDLGPLLEALGQPVAPDQLSQVAAQLDRNGRVTVGELVLWWNS